MPKFIAGTLLLAVLAAGSLFAQKKLIHPKEFPKGGPFSPGIQVGTTLYVAGQIGRDLKTGKIPENFEEEVALTLDNIGIVLKEAGYSFADAVSVHVYLTDMDLFQRMNSVYIKYFPDPKPVRTTVGTPKLAAAAARIEITVTAQK
jgi:reactive intermediate/imine deaminase